jgi:hypothetical protein
MLLEWRMVLEGPVAVAARFGGPHGASLIMGIGVCSVMVAPTCSSRGSGAAVQAGND